MNVQRIITISLLVLLSTFTLFAQNISSNSSKKLFYLTPDLSIPFWQIVAKGIRNQSKALDYSIEVLDAHNKAKDELQNTVQAIKAQAKGIIVSPTNSSACVTILKLAKKANIPVVIADIGTLEGEYVSYISSNNFEGAYNVGQVLTQHLIQKGWQDGRVGIIAIPQKRLNGKQRTDGFMQALNETNLKGADLKQLEVWNNAETYRFTTELLQTYPDLRAIWLQTSNNYQGILDALKDQGKQDEIIFVAFDAEPDFLQLIPQGTILATGMQQPYLMGQKSVQTLHQYFNKEPVSQKIVLPILNVTSENISSKLPLIQLNVLGISPKE